MRHRKWYCYKYLKTRFEYIMKRRFEYMFTTLKKFSTWLTSYNTLRRTGTFFDILHGIFSSIKIFMIGIMMLGTIFLYDLLNNHIPTMSPDVDWIIHFVVLFAMLVEVCVFFCRMLTRDLTCEISPWSEFVSLILLAIMWYARKVFPWTSYIFIYFFGNGKHFIDLAVAIFICDAAIVGGRKEIDKFFYGSK